MTRQNKRQKNQNANNQQGMQEVEFAQELGQNSAVQSGVAQNNNNMNKQTNKNQKR